MRTTTPSLLAVMVGMALVEVHTFDIQEGEWGFQAYLNEDYTLECNHSSLAIASDDSVSWELPNHVELTQAHMESNKYLLHDGTTGVVNMKLTVKAVSEKDAGVYLCHIHTMSNTTRGFLLRGLNLAGPLYRDPFDEYRQNLMIGGIAAACLVVPLLGGCFLYKFRYQTSEQRSKKHELRKDQFKHQRYLAEHEKEHGIENGTELATPKGGNINPAFHDSLDTEQESSGQTHL